MVSSTTPIVAASTPAPLMPKYSLSAVSGRVSDGLAPAGTTPSPRASLPRSRKNWSIPTCGLRDAPHAPRSSASSRAGTTGPASTPPSNTPRPLPTRRIIIVSPQLPDRPYQLRPPKRGNTSDLRYQVSAVVVDVAVPGVPLSTASV